MNVRKVNLSLWALAALLAGGGILAAGFAVFSPVEVGLDEAAVPRRAKPSTSQVSPDALLSLDGYGSIWTTDYRKPLSDSVAATTQENNPANTADGTGGPFVLVGTIGDSLAMVRMASGAIEIKGIGEEANGAKIVAIRPMQVDVEAGGVRTTISKPREPGGE